MMIRVWLHLGHTLKKKKKKKRNEEQKEKCDNCQVT